MTAIGTPPPYTPHPSTTPAFGAEAAAVMAALHACSEIHYDPELLLVDASATVISDLTVYLTKAAVPSVTHDSTAEVPGRCSFTLDADLRWGSDMVQPSLLVMSPEYQQGAWQRFPLGVFVATTPQAQLQTLASRQVTGYDRNYLLQNQLADSFVAAATTTYKAGVEAMMRAAGLLGVSADLSTIATFPGDWPAKTVPADSDMTFPIDTGAQNYIGVINELLKASGCRPLFTNPDGRFAIQAQLTPASQPQQWTFARTGTQWAPGFPAGSIVDQSKCTIQRDVYNQPNQWVFIQQGLSFAPVASDGSDGRYVVNNTTHRPSDQTSVGRVLRSTQFLNASGQADLIAQGDAIVAAAYAQAEKITLTTGPWGAAGHYDVFWYTDEELPDTNLRKVQAQQWTLPFNGDPMTWQTLVVASQ